MLALAVSQQVLVNLVLPVLSVLVQVPFVSCVLATPELPLLAVVLPVLLSFVVAFLTTPAALALLVALLVADGAAVVEVAVSAWGG